MTLKFSNDSNKELEIKIKKQKLFSWVHGIILVFLFVVATYKTYVDGSNFSSFFPLFFIPMQIVLHLETKKMKKELLLRKLKKKGTKQKHQAVKNLDSF